MQLHEHFLRLVVEVEEFLSHRSVRLHAVNVHILGHFHVQRTCQFVVLIVDVDDCLVDRNVETSAAIVVFLGVVPHVSVFVVQEPVSLSLHRARRCRGLGFSEARCRRVEAMKLYERSIELLGAILFRQLGEFAISREVASCGCRSGNECHKAVK